jgi:hypothetical protein
VNQQPPEQHEGQMVGGFDNHPTLVISRLQEVWLSVVGEYSV